ncbi:hypothetical protein [Salinactinospora qingdaonensis]|uniref:Uncharacterized protein n=1 Tax=Salinactinospora qingdaonensis TaxID=702744 RepID=A0ABP7EXZ8_9ACTN
MSVLVRVLLVATLAAGVVMVPAAGAGARSGAGGSQTAHSLDGFTVTALPPQVGEVISDFDYEWQRVAFSSRVWERRTGSGYRADLVIAVLRGERLRDPAALREFLANYHEQEARAWSLRDFRHADGSGFIGAERAFWLVSPGVAVSVRLDGERFAPQWLQTTARGVRSPYRG